jgi:biopolymer transport protein ExbD
MFETVNLVPMVDTALEILVFAVPELMPVPSGDQLASITPYLPSSP